MRKWVGECESSYEAKLRSKSVSNTTWILSISFRLVHFYFSIAIIFVVCVLILFTIASLHFPSSSSFSSSFPFMLPPPPPLVRLFRFYCVCVCLYVSPDLTLLHCLCTGKSSSVVFFFTAYECLVNRKLHFQNNNCKKLQTPECIKWLKSFHETNTQEREKG